MKITKGRLKQIIKEEVGSFTEEASDGQPSVDDVKGMLAKVAQGLLQDPPLPPSREEAEGLYNGLVSLSPDEEPVVDTDDFGDLGAVNE